jgi:hypothetical protein
MQSSRTNGSKRREQITSIRADTPQRFRRASEFLLFTALRKQGIEALAEVTVPVSATRFFIPT